MVDTHVKSTADYMCTWDLRDQIYNDQTTHCSRILAHNLEHLSRKPNHNFCSNQPQDSQI